MTKIYNEKTSPLQIKEGKKSTSPFAEEFTFTNLPNPLPLVIGNSLRQILLNNIFGWGILAVRVKNQEKTATSEFDKELLKGVNLALPYLILNLKQLVFQTKSGKVNNQEIQHLKIKIDNSQNDREVTGKDIQGELEIINPEVYLLTVSQHSQLEIDLYCRYYWGYYLAKEQRTLLPQEKNLIFLDTNYSPVEKVATNIEKTIIDLDKEEEKLLLTITTNGGISPRNALTESLKIWKELGNDLFSLTSDAKV